MLSMETKTQEQQAPGNAQVIPNQNNPDQAPGLPQGSNQAETSAIPFMTQQQARQPNTSSVQASSLTSIGQNMLGVNQTSTMQNVKHEKVHAGAYLVLQNSRLVDEEMVTRRLVNLLPRLH